MDLGKGIKDGGGYDLEEIARAEEALGSNIVNEKEFEDVDAMYIEVKQGNIVRTETFEARVVNIDYDENDEIIGVELL